MTVGEKLQSAKQSVADGCQQIKEKFEEHPQESNQSYWSHLGGSLKQGGITFYHSLQYLVHGIFPFWCGGVENHQNPENTN